MSMILAAKAWKIKLGNPIRKMILIKLADNANDDGECWPSYQHIADQCETSRRTVIRHIEELEKMGLLKKTIRKTKLGNSSNMFLLTLPSEGHLVRKNPSATESPPSVTESPPSVTESPPSVTESPTPSVTESPRISHSLNQSMNQSINHSDDEKTDAPKVVRKKAAQPKKTKTSLTDDFSLSDEWKQWAKTENKYHTDESVERLFENFKDYWLGEGGTKLDWFATWRNWVRRDFDKPTKHQNVPLTACGLPKTFDHVDYTEGTFLREDGTRGF